MTEARNKLYRGVREILSVFAKEEVAKHLSAVVIEGHLDKINKLSKDGAQPIMVTSAGDVCAWISWLPKGLMPEGGVDSCRHVKIPKTHSLWFSVPFNITGNLEDSDVKTQVNNVFSFLSKVQGEDLSPKDKDWVIKKLKKGDDEVPFRVKGSTKFYLNSNYQPPPPLMQAKPDDGGEFPEWQLNGP